MNPQLHYTPQQQMGYGGYSVPCRIGNWAEDEYLGALHTAEHKAKSEVGALTTQKLGDMIGRALAPVSLTSPPADGAIRFGDSLMLTSAQGGALGIHTSKKVDLTHEGFLVTRTTDGGAVPCTRTCWTVAPIGAPPEDGLLRVGMRFYLKNVSDGSDFYLESVRYSLSNLNYSRGMHGAQRKQGVCATRSASTDTAWEVVVLEPSDLAQLESRGKPVLANTFLSLKHCSTQANLCSDDFQVPTKFGMEFEATVHTESGIAKAEWGKRTAAVGVGNHWAFTTAA